MYIASLVLGILAIVLSWIPVIGFIISIAALIISIVAMVKKKNEGKGMAIAGIILSILAVIFSLIMTLMTVGAAYALNENAEDIRENAQETINLADIANAKAEFAAKYADIMAENMNNEYTGYIDKETELYVSKYNGVELEEYLEEYLEDKYPEFDVEVELGQEGKVLSFEVE